MTDTLAPILPDDTSPHATLLGLVSRYSPSGAEEPAVDWLVERMGFIGFTQAFRDQAGNAVGILGSGPRQVVLLGHIDTVPGEIPVRVEDGTLFGRGSVDAKAPLAAFVDAAARLGARQGWQVVVVGCVEEERESEGARYATGQYSPEYAIIGEPSGWEALTLGYKGSAWMEVSLKQPVAHTAGQGQSACEAAFEVWKAVQAWAERYNEGKPRTFDKASPTLRKFTSGDDGFEEWARLRIGIRLPLSLPPDDWYEQMRGLLKQMLVEGLMRPDLEVSLEQTGYPIPAYLGNKNNPLVRACLSGIRAVKGQPGFLVKLGTADMNLVAPAWGCPALAYGPGDSSLDHTPNERLSLQEYDRAVQVLQRALELLCQQEADPTS